MRDINRIPLFIERFVTFWNDNPDLRFGQIVEILRRELGVDDLFYLEDEHYIMLLEKLNNKGEKNKW